ncbi:MAG: Tfp pilus assembly protein FimT/FimU, partial [Planctomycetaceae bacterium]
MQAQQPRREGFTLVELLVVMGILVLLASVTLMAFNSNRGGDRIRSAARSAQSAFLSARDRAMQAKDLRGIRLIVNTTDKICTGFQLIRPLP